MLLGKPSCFGIVRTLVLSCITVLFGVLLNLGFSFLLEGRLRLFALPSLLSGLPFRHWRPVSGLSV